MAEETAVGGIHQDIPVEGDGLRIQLDGPVLRLTMTRPDARNAQTPSLWARLRAARDLAVSSEVQAVVLAGEGTSFSAGLDTRMLTPEGVPGEGSLIKLAMGDDTSVHAMITEIQDAFSWFSDIPAITIAAVQGHAVGAGFQIALACDCIICADDAKFSMAEAKYGLIPDLTGTSPLVRTVGYKRALDICLTTRRVEAAEAVQLGIALDSVPSEELATRTQQVVDSVVAAVPGTASELKKLLANAVIASPADQRVAERNAQIQRFKWLKQAMGV